MADKLNFKPRAEVLDSGERLTIDVALVAGQILVNDEPAEYKFNAQNIHFVVVGKTFVVTNDMAVPMNIDQMDILIGRMLQVELFEGMFLTGVCD